MDRRQFHKLLYNFDFGSTESEIKANGIETKPSIKLSTSHNINVTSLNSDSGHATRKEANIM